MKRTLFALAAATLVTLPAVTVPVLADEAAFARASGCMACHAVDRRMVGPSFRDISARYAGQADAVARMTVKVQRGGSGVWGPVPMPANPRLSEADARRLATWSLSHR
ncbi:c-type cytochrome [Serpentinimonas barnesii]|uniref:c-type cytochrome n=1 Tax=Serpentinimonas barnesii TaxID=1458427 RepID=UPI0004980483|nr:c-type cytochrome [Serpentinimonas barnesii]